MSDDEIQAIIEKLYHPHDGTFNGIDAMSEGIRRGLEYARKEMEKK